LTSEESVSRHVSVQIVDILDIFCEQTLAISIVSCVFDSSDFCPSYLLWCVVWWSIGLSCLTAKLLACRK